MSRGIITVVRGLPGSGKSTFCRNTFPERYHVENDMFLMTNGKYCFTPERRDAAIMWCQKSVEIAMKCGMDICVSNVFPRCKTIRLYEEMAMKYGYDFEVIRMTGKYGNIHNVPKDVLESMEENMEAWPDEIIM